MSEVTFADWVGSRVNVHPGTNFGSQELAFQGWQKFKESFAPEVVQRAIMESRIPVRKVLDPFGGSGTTALASQFIGAHPVSIEVNPYLADLIESKVTRYGIETLKAESLAFLARSSALASSNLDAPRSWPATFVEPGVNHRWIFSRRLAAYLDALVEAASQVQEIAIARLFKMAIGGSLVALSNVRINGKGRRYRGGWRDREKSPDDAHRLIASRLEAMVDDIETFASRSCLSAEVLRGDSRELLPDVVEADVAVFSPPYPNSFDYTDVYNLELWVLRYLRSTGDNRALRLSTLSSHVQLSREFEAAPTGSATLDLCLESLESVRAQLWSSHLPDMVGSYFAEMADLLDDVRSALRPEGAAWLVVGDSSYAGIAVPAGKVLGELAQSRGWTLTETNAFRSMRSSSQQGGALALPESLLVLHR